MTGKAWEGLDWGEAHLVPLPLQWVNDSGKISIVDERGRRMRPPEEVSGGWFGDGKFYTSDEILRPLLGAEDELFPALLEPASGEKVPGFFMPRLYVAVIGWLTRWFRQEDGRLVPIPRYEPGASGRTTALVTVDARTFFELRARGLAGASLSRGLIQARQIVSARTGGRARLFGFRVHILGGSRATTPQGAVWTPIQVIVPGDLDEAFVGVETARELIRMDREGIFQNWQRFRGQAVEEEIVSEVAPARETPPEDEMELLAWVMASPERTARAAKALSGGDEDMGALLVDVLNEARSPAEAREALIQLAGTGDEGWPHIVAAIRNEFSA